MIRALGIAALALLFTHLFFFEYRAGAKQVHVPYDMDGYHYPLADYAFRSLKQGRFPEWDPTMYSGLPFAANVQAALFYPPQWVAFAVDWGRERLSYRVFQDLLFLHVWAGFVLSWLWFRWRGMHWLAATLGAGVFAYSGYVMHQLQHFGLVAGYAWFPLGFWGVDRLDASRRSRAAWMVVAASALCFLAGYTPFWIVFCVCMTAYAAARSWFAVTRCVAALAVSLAVCAVQLLPAIEASASMVRDFRYGPVDDPGFHLSWLVPNYFHFELGVPVETHPGRDLLYLGAAGLGGLLLAAGRWRKLGPAAAVLGACLVFLLDPFEAVTGLLRLWPLGAQMIRGYYFLAGVTSAVAVAAAMGFDDVLRARRVAALRWADLGGVVGAVLCALWALWLVVRWRSDWLAQGAGSIADAVAGVLLVVAAVTLYRRCVLPVRVVLAVALVALAGAEYKVFGTSKRVNAAAEGSARVSDVSNGMDPELLRQMGEHPEYRCAIDIGGLFSTKLRHIGLTTPQGFDPLLPSAYKRLIDSAAGWRTDREFEFDVARPDVLRLFGVRYFITSEYGPRWAALNTDGRYRMLRPPTSYFKVFELADAAPPFGWDQGSGSARVTGWRPERREFAVRSDAGGVFRLSEQYFAGWRARVDGSLVEIQRCHEALQCVSVPAGEHRVEYVFASQSLRAGAWISLLSLMGACVWAMRRARQSAD